MIRKALILKIHDAASMQRWNDKIRPVEPREPINRVTRWSSPSYWANSRKARGDILSELMIG